MSSVTLWHVQLKWSDVGLCCLRTGDGLSVCVCVCVCAFGGHVATGVVR